MSDRKARTSGSLKTHSVHPPKMVYPPPGVSNLTALLQGAPTAGSVSIVRCPADTLTRIRQLNEAEVITLFTPFVPHPPSTVLARDMDPFEPLGRALPRQVRHVPFRLDHGMTETHAGFLPASGVVIIVICSTENVTDHNAHAFEQQAKFARDVVKRSGESKHLSGVPLVLLLVTDGAASQFHRDGLSDFPALVTCNNYTTAALSNVVRAIFGN
ncbi:hypothetical protein BDV95DRAFT_599565 [Massariosphaeria phaeospora]|uniref:Uncharacterized protein n=1 Tax=Massariosphaeria phaeospora TaxID=100035 RepID=A0A7C8M2D6_9PLEO|nr:hypothetical protein BDV95DRAFT_599565 [Massariosphaeria phaeospora]